MYTEFNNKNEQKENDWSKDKQYIINLFSWKIDHGKKGNVEQIFTIKIKKRKYATKFRSTKSTSKCYQASLQQRSCVQYHIYQKLRMNSFLQKIQIRISRNGTYPCISICRTFWFRHCWHILPFDEKTFRARRRRKISKLPVSGYKWILRERFPNKSCSNSGPIQGLEPTSRREERSSAMSREA